ncbi:hypothetical protein ACFPRL_23880 [Pseudoclavibacter helvolus]
MRELRCAGKHRGCALGGRFRLGGDAHEGVAGPGECGRDDQPCGRVTHESDPEASFAAAHASPSDCCCSRVDSAEAVGRMPFWRCSRSWRRVSGCGASSSAGDGAAGAAGADGAAGAADAGGADGGADGGTTAAGAFGSATGGTP